MLARIRVTRTNVTFRHVRSWGGNHAKWLSVVSRNISVALLPAGAAPAQAQSAALTGQVSSADEPAMEGVLVSAKKTGSAVTVGSTHGASIVKLEPLD